MTGKQRHRSSFRRTKPALHIAAGVLVALLALPVVIARADVEVLFADDFERPDGVWVGNGWVEVDGDSSAEAALSGGGLVFQSDDDTYQPSVTREFAGRSTGVVQWDLAFDWERTGSEGTYEVGMQLGDGGEAAVDLRWGGPNNGLDTHEGLGYVSGGGAVTQVATVTGAETIRVRADLDAGTFDLDVDPGDGRVEASAVPLAAQVPVDTVRLYADAVNTAKFAGERFDDVVVSWSGQEPVDDAPPVVSGVAASAVGESGATIGWATDEPADSQVEYGTAPCPCPQLTPLDPALARDHAVALEGLEPGTTYHYRVRSRDAAGNLAVGSERTFTTTTPEPPPDPAEVLFADDFERADAASVGNGWVELEESSSAEARVEGGALVFASDDDSYQPSASREFDARATGVVEWVFGFDWERTGSEGTYEVGMQVGDGDEAAVDLRWGGPNNGLDTHEGLGHVSGVGSVTQIATVSGPETIRVRADLDAGTFDLDLDPADGVVEAAAVPLAAAVPVDTVRLFAHAVNSAKLGGERFDDLEVSWTAGGSGDSPDETPPAIADVTAGGIGATTATVTWTTDEPADSRVAYGTAPCPCTSGPPADHRLVQAHSIRLTGLQPETTYFYEVTSADAAGNASTSATLSFTTPAASGIATAGNRFTLDGAPFDMWGVRTASATQDQAQTDHLIAQLDEYLAHGVNTVTVFYMGSRGASYDPFTPDGLAVDAGHQGRMEQIVEAADARGMVVIAGIFYQHAPLGLRDAEAVRNAVRTVTRELQPYDNVIVNIANEQNSTGWSDTEEIYDFRDPQAIVDLCRVVHEEDPARLAGAGGFDQVRNEVIGAAPEVDALLFDTSGPDSNSDAVHDRYVDAGITGKPLVNVEVFGGWTREFERGVFADAVKQEYYEEIDAGASRPGLGVFFHNSPWMQEEPMRYDLAGSGTSSDPGIRWYFERVRLARGL